MLVLILCICKAFRLGYVLTVSFSLSNTNQYINKLKDDTVYLEANVTFLQ